MKGLFVILILLSAACTHEVRISEEDFVAGVFYKEGSYKPYTGKCTVTFAGGKNVAAELSYLHGYLDGEATLLYANGKVKQKGFFCRGEMCGTWQFWDATGKKTGEYTFSKH